jgi:ATP-dependent RNA helicase HrpB
MIPLPIDAALPAIRAALDRPGLAVLQAPPGAGKTTRVPVALCDAPWLAGRRIVMLEPRRLATRAAARWMSRSLGEQVGGTVGYRIRRESRTGPRTRIEVVTEGILTRMLLEDPGLEDVGLVVFDEFHERSVHADLGLALALQSRNVMREDLRILVMSATLEAEPVARLLGDAPVITSEGRSYPVTTRYLPVDRGQWLEPTTAAAVRRALAEESGDLLVFLPGAGEIRRTADQLDIPGVDVHQLYGALPQDDQDRALGASPPGRRKVVLATSIAETSLTIDGVGVVVDAGWSRVPRYSPRSGMTRLATVRVTRAGADQRRGRAGRQGPGVCYRLWSEVEEHGFLPRPTPEILETDLAPLALDLAAAGIHDPADLAWLDPPPAAAFAEARSLLRALGALDSGGRISAHGRAVARLGTHPRLAHLLIRGAELDSSRTAAALVALLEERDLLRGDQGPPDPDLTLRLELLEDRTCPASHHGHAVDREGLRRVRAEMEAWHGQIGRGAERGGVSPGVLLALAYPDRVAQRREGQAGRFVLENGQGAALDAASLALADYLVAAELDGSRRDSRIHLAAPITLAEIEEHFSGLTELVERVELDQATGAIIAREEERLGALVLRQSPVRNLAPGRVRAIWLELIRREGLGILHWDGGTAVRGRLACLHAIDPAWPDVSDQALLADLETWLGPALEQPRRRDDLSRIDPGALLLERLDWNQRRRLDQLAPTHVEVPSGSRIAVDYTDPTAPVLAVRLQEVFGLTDTPRIAEGKMPLTLHLLSPARRPVQVTRDLASFWRTTYAEVRKDLKGRYPKHYWPEDPHTAEAVRGGKRRD